MISRAKNSLIYRLRNKGFRIDTRKKTVYINKDESSDMSELKRLRNEFNFIIQTEIEERTSARVYISGPIAHYDILERKNAFHKIERMLRKSGYLPVNPFNNGLPQPGDWKEHMKADIHMLLSSQYIYFMPNWELSKGCKLELDVATSCGIKILHF